MKLSIIRCVVRGLLCLIVGAGVGLHVGGCLAPQQCETLRADLRAQLDSWRGCDPTKGDDQCAIVGGDPSDCTGVLSCDFAVNVSNLRAAQDAVVDNSVHREICGDFCSMPTCAADSLPICDPALRQCVIPFLEAGARPVAGSPSTPNPGMSDAQAE